MIGNKPICYRVTKRTMQQEILAIMNLYKRRLRIVLPPKVAVRIKQAKAPSAENSTWHTITAT